MDIQNNYNMILSERWIQIQVSWVQLIFLLQQNRDIILYWEIFPLLDLWL